MHIDWLTVSAQIVNFLVLVYILKRFLYGPVLAAMARRQARIASRLAEAQQREQEAQATRERYAASQQAFERDRQALLSQARDDVARERAALLEQARHEVEASRRAWWHDLERERDDARSRLRQSIADCGLAAARILLGELAGERLEGRMVERFLERLAEFDASALLGACVASGRLRVRSAAELDAAQRARITRAIHEQLAPDLQIDYEPEAALLAGIELEAGGLRVGWTLADNLAELEARVGASLRPHGPRGDGSAMEARGG